MSFPHENLEVYKAGKEIVDEVYEMVKKFPKTETYNLVSQLQRCSTSICLNLAEGQGRHTPRDCAKFVSISSGSLAETVAGLDMAMGHGYITEEEYGRVYKKAEVLGRRLWALRKAKYKQYDKQNITR